MVKETGTRWSVQEIIELLSTGKLEYIAVFQVSYDAMLSLPADLLEFEDHLLSLLTSAGSTSAWSQSISAHRIKIGAASFS